MIEATTKFTNHVKNLGDKQNGTATIHQEQKIRMEGKGIKKEDLTNIFANNNYSTIEQKFRKVSENEDKKMEDEIRAISEKNERINREREAKRIEKQKRIEEKKAMGLPLSDSLSDLDEKSRSRRETYNQMKDKMRSQRMKKLRRCRTAFQEPAEEEEFQREEKEGEEKFDKFKFLRQSTHREASPKKGLLKRSKTSKVNERKVKFLPPKVKYI